MNAVEIRAARKALGLSLSQMAAMLGYQADRGTMYRIEKGERTIKGAQARLVRAYLTGYRPHDWPEPKHETEEAA